MDPYFRSEYDVTDLTWGNGQLSMHGLVDGPSPDFQTKQPTWLSSADDDTLESIIHQAAFQSSQVHVHRYQNHAPNSMTPPPVASSQGFSLENPTAAPITAGGSPTAKSSRDKSTNYDDDNDDTSMRRTWDSLKSPSSFKTKTTYDQDSACHSGSKPDEARQGKGETISRSHSTRRIRSASIHNQSERRRRDRINQKLKSLQKLVPNASKTDKASMLDEVINHLKQLKAQVQMMNVIRNMPHDQMMAPLALQHQLQMSLLAPMAIGAGMLNMNPVAPPPSASRSRHPVLLPATTASSVPLRYPYNAFLAQAMNMDLYSGMATFHHQQMSQKAEVKMNQSQMDHPQDN